MCVCAHVEINPYLSVFPIIMVVFQMRYCWFIFSDTLLYSLTFSSDLHVCNVKYILYKCDIYNIFYYIL